MEWQMAPRILRRRWLLILLPLAVGAAFALPDLVAPRASAGGYSAQIRYSAAQEMNLPQRDGDYQDVWLASELTVNAFTDWARSSSFRAEIEAGLDDENDDISGLGIAADNSRSIGVVYLSHGDAPALERIAAAAIDVLRQRSQAYFPQLGGEAAKVTILEAPVIQAAPPALSSRFAPLLQLAASLFAGLLLAIGAEYVDPRVHDLGDLRRMGLPVVGSVPRQ